MKNVFEKWAQTKAHFNKNGKSYWEEEDEESTFVWTSSGDYTNRFF